MSLLLACKTGMLLHPSPIAKLKAYAVGQLPMHFFVQL
jgi:hypothetical protein